MQFLFCIILARRLLPLPLGELSPKVTERGKAALNDKILVLPSPSSPSSLRSATSPKGRGKGMLAAIQLTGTADHSAVPVNCLMRIAHCK